MLWRKPRIDMLPGQRGPCRIKFRLHYRNRPIAHAAPLAVAFMLVRNSLMRANKSAW